MNTPSPLQQRRVSAGLSQSAVGKVIGWQQSRVSLFERTTTDVNSPEARAYIAAIDKLLNPPTRTREPTRRAKFGGPRKSPQPIKPRGGLAELTVAAVIRVPSDTAAGVALGKINEIIAKAKASLPKGWEFSVTDVNLR